MSIEPVRPVERPRAQRLHISVGSVCNNNCLFCMEEDRDSRRINNAAMTLERVRWTLEQNVGCEEVCFTSGEPTTRGDLLEMVRVARDLGYPRISLMTNGRRLSHVPYARALARSGINRLYISIHGHSRALHEGLTRTAGSFGQTVAGIDNAAKLKPSGVQLHTSTVLTKRNLPHLLDIYLYLRARGVDQVVFNVMQPNGRAEKNFKVLYPSYTSIADQFRALCHDGPEVPAQAFLVDIPFCVSEGVPDFNRGFVEAYRHLELESHVNLCPSVLSERRQLGQGEGLVLVTRSDFDQARRIKRPECALCRCDGVCDGVWSNYVRHFGWDEFRPL